MGTAEFSWERSTNRGEVARLLREIADGLDDEGGVEIEQDGMELKLSVPDAVEVEVGVEIDGDSVELEIELSWSSADGEAEEAEETGEG